MALTREQFDELRSKGLSVEQIVKFEKGEQTQQQQPPSSGGFIRNVGGKLQERGREFVSEIGKSATGDLASTKLGTIGRGTLRTGSLIGGSIGDILIEGIKAVLPEKTEQKIKEVTSNMTSKELPQKIIQSISSWAEKNPTAAKDLEGALEIAGIFPIVKGGKVASKAVIQTGKEVAGDIGKVAGKTLATTGAITEKAGKSLVSATFPPTASQAKSILDYKSTTPLLKRVQLAAKSAEKAPITPSEVALKYNLVGLSRSEIGAKAKRVANQLFENQVNPVINGIEKVVKPKEIFDRVKKTISKIADTSKKKSLLNALDSLKDDYKNVSRLSYKKLDQIKSEMAKGLPAKVWKGQDIAGELNNVRKMFSDEARKLIRKELPDNVKRIYDEYGSLLSIMEKGEKSLQRGLDVGILGLTSEAIRRGATPLTTIGGKAINKAGEIIKGVGQRLQKGGTKLKKSGEKGSLLNVKPGLSIEDVSKPLPKGKGEIPKTTPKTPLVSKTEQSLIKEAKKYKTADEFIKEQGTPVYHGTSKQFDKFDTTKISEGNLGKGIYLTDNQTAAKYHSLLADRKQLVKEVNPKTLKYRDEKLGEIMDINISKDAKIKEFSKMPTREMVNKARQEGFDGVKYPDTLYKTAEDWNFKLLGEMKETPNTTLLFNSDKIKTKSQLQDIWNKANK